MRKLAATTAVMDKVDRGLVTLGQRLRLSGDITSGGSGIYHSHGVWGDDITITVAMRVMSDNTAVRLCGLVAPALENHDILAAKGFVKTRVEPVTNPTGSSLASPSA